MKLFFLLLILLSLFSEFAFAQIGMGGQPHPSAALDVRANDKAFYPPRLTTTQRKAIINPQAGAFVYDLDQSTFYLFDGANWMALALQGVGTVAPTTRLASDGAPENYFGSVAISGDYAVVGAFGNSANGNFWQGAAYIFLRSGNVWTEQQKLTLGDGASMDGFGVDVAISGDYIVVSAGAKTINGISQRGAAYVFYRSGNIWSQQAQLSPSDGAAFDNFGGRVSIAGDYIVLSAAGKDIGGNSNQGAAYVFVRSGITWTEQQRLTANDGATNDGFGTSISISDDRLIVGCSDKTISGKVAQGAAYVYLRNGTQWSQQARLTPTNGDANERFGSSVSLSGSYAVIGAPQKAVSGTNSGVAYVFAYLGTAWTEQFTLFPNFGATGDNFGSSVSIAGDYALVGAPQKTVGSNRSQGAAYLFKRMNTSWKLIRTVVDDSPPSTSLGRSVNLSGGTYGVGGTGYNNNQGKVSFGILEN